MDSRSFGTIETGLYPRNQRYSDPPSRFGHTEYVPARCAARLRSSAITVRSPDVARFRHLSLPLLREAGNSATLPTPWARVTVWNASRTGTTEAPGNFFGPAREIRIPGMLNVEAGNMGNGQATLSLTLADGTTRSCSYRGLAETAHPTLPGDIAQGRTSALESCTLNTSLPVTITGATLRVLSADSLVGTTTVSIAAGSSTTCTSTSLTELSRVF